MDLRHPLQQQGRQQVVEVPAGEARSALRKGRWRVDGMRYMGYMIYDIWIYIYMGYMDSSSAYIWDLYGINMEADDESIFYKYDAKATKYGDLLFVFGRRVLCLLARGH